MTHTWFPRHRTVEDWAADNGISVPPHECAERLAACLLRDAARVEYYRQRADRIREAKGRKAANKVRRTNAGLERRLERVERLAHELARLLDGLRNDILGRA